MTLTDLGPRRHTEPPVATTSEDPGAQELASWPARAGAIGLDVLPGAAVLTATALVAMTVPLRGGWWWACVGLGATAGLWTGLNRLLLPGASGQSLGRKYFGITLVRSDGSDAGPFRRLLRELAHLLDTAPVFLGWLWPLKDPHRRTFADVIARTETRVTPTSGAARRSAISGAAISVVLTAAALCAAGAGTSVTVIALQDRADTDASTEITAQGPHIVEQILSYHPETIDDDFARAQSLVTEGYRGQLTTQQQAVRKTRPVRNEFWVTNSAVLSAGRGQATVLLFLQGQRGAPPQQRYLTATVRVNFVHTDSAPWRVDELTVVTSPQPIQATP